MAKYLSNIDLNKNELQNAVIHPLGTAPLLPVEGQIYYDSSVGDKHLYLYNGTAWIQLSEAPDSNDFLTALSFATGTGILTATVQNQSNVTVNLDGRYLTGNQTITLTGEVTGAGATSISTTVADAVLDVANFTAAAIVTEADTIAGNDNDTTLPTSAAVKDYVDTAIVGGLVYQGGYDAATNTPDLDSSPSSNIKKGWTYTVTADGSFFTEQVRVGDVLIAENDAPTTLAEWTTVQNNIDLASLTQVGIGNVVGSTSASLKGLSVAYSNGTATAGLNIAGLTTQAPANNALAFIPFYDQFAGANLKIGLSTLAGDLNEYTSKAFTISGTNTITHNFNTRDVIIQLYDTVTYETVYADVDRISTNEATITFASTPANSIRVLVQKIG